MRKNTRKQYENDTFIILHCIIHIDIIEAEGGVIMTQKQLIELLAALRKLEIENNPNLSHYQKELLKMLIDEIKARAK